MKRGPWRKIAACLASAAVALSPAAESRGCFGLFNRNQCQSPAYVAQSACAPQVVNYVPQTCYRMQYVQVPVVTYQRVPTYDPATGCPVTCMRPTTSYVMQARRVPYTTYRLVYSNPCAAAAPAMATTYYQPPAAGYAVPRANGCSSCGVGGAYGAPTYSTPGYTTPGYSSPTYTTPGPTTPAPSLPGYTTTPAPNFGTPIDANGLPYSSASPIISSPSFPTPAVPSAPTGNVPSGGLTPTITNPSPSTPTNVGPQTPVPTINGQGAPQAPATNAPAASGATSTTRMQPIPDVGSPTTIDKNMTLPKVIDPNARTTSMPVYRPWAYSTVSWGDAPAVAIAPSHATQPANAAPQPAAAPETYNLNGWRASRR